MHIYFSWLPFRSTVEITFKRGESCWKERGVGPIVTLFLEHFSVLFLRLSFIPVEISFCCKRWLKESGAGPFWKCYFYVILLYLFKALLLKTLFYSCGNKFLLWEVIERKWGRSILKVLLPSIRIFQSIAIVWISKPGNKKRSFVNNHFLSSRAPATAHSIENNFQFLNRSPADIVFWCAQHWAQCRPLIMLHHAVHIVIMMVLIILSRN